MGGTWFRSQSEGRDAEIWMFPKNRGVKPPKMDGENNVPNPIKMDDLGGFPTFLETLKLPGHEMTGLVDTCR